MWVRANGECYVEQHSCSKKSPSVDFYKMRFSCSWFPGVFSLTVEIWKMCSSFHRLFLHRSCGPRPPWGRLALTDSSPPTSSTKQSTSEKPSIVSSQELFRLPCDMVHSWQPLFSLFTQSKATVILIHQLFWIATNWSMQLRAIHATNKRNYYQMTDHTRIPISHITGKCQSLAKWS